jgi:hypothetical protein
MTPAYPGLLVVQNDIVATDEAEFNAWYVEEHFPERLAVPGFLTARRYRDVSAPQRYAAIYDSASVAVFTSPAYLERLANPTPRTRDIMPRFRNMTRAACEVVADRGSAHSPGQVLAWIELDAPPVAAHQDALAAAASVGRLRVVLPDAGSTQVPNPEAKFRDGPDRLPPSLLLVEGNDESAVAEAAAGVGKALGAPQPARLFRLLLAQDAGAGEQST